MKYHEKNDYESEVFVAIHDRKKDIFYSFATCENFDVKKVLGFAETKGMRSFSHLEKRKINQKVDTSSETETKR